mmetsp:Transcript_96495/g.208241  ORF Transcript_96495/g.208241 Transcript_96495/m.208241 type:complete len:179 (-) Transcript_96495:46-582(-)
MAGLNGVLTAVRACAFVLKLGTLVPCSGASLRLDCLLPTWLCISAVAQLAAVFYSYEVYKLMHTRLDSSGAYTHPEALEGGDGARDSGERGVGDPALAPFRGTGHRMAEPGAGPPGEVGGGRDRGRPRGERDASGGGEAPGGRPRGEDDAASRGRPRGPRGDGDGDDLGGFARGGMTP